ncbi:MAG: hypothetical protein AABZ30_11460 [Myxococcota bacterium]
MAVILLEAPRTFTKNETQSTSVAPRVDDLMAPTIYLRVSGGTLSAGSVVFDFEVAPLLRFVDESGRFATFGGQFKITLNSPLPATPFTLFTPTALNLSAGLLRWKVTFTGTGASDFVEADLYLVGLRFGGNGRLALPPREP